MIPQPWEFALLALAAYRLWRLLAEDTILDKPRQRLGLDESDLVTCPWCLGAWVTVGWWAAWSVWPHAVLIVAAPFALSAAVGVAALVADRLSD